MDLETLSVSLKLVADQFRQGIAAVKADVAGLKGNLASAGQSIKGFGKGLTDVGKNMSAKVTAPILGFGLFAVKQASDLNEAWSAASTVYGKGADVIIAKSKQAAGQVGLSQEEYLGTAATLGVFANSAGLAGEDAANFSSELITGAADLSSFYNAAGGVPEVLDAVKSGLAGETEPLRKYGILVNEAALNEYAYANGIANSGDKLTEQQKVLARQGFILSHLGAAQGDFERTSGGLANQQRILTARFKDVSAQIGQQLLPLALKLATGLSNLLTRIQGISPGMLKWGVAIAMVAAAVGPLLIIVGQMAVAIGALAPAFALLLGPVGLVIAALVLLGVAYKTNFLGFGDAVRAVAGFAKAFAKSFMSLYRVFRKMEAPKVMAAFMALGQVLSDMTGLGLLPFFTRIGAAVNRFVASFQKIGDALNKIIHGNFQAGFKQLLSGIGDFLAAPAKMVGDLLKGISTGFAPLDTFLHNIGKLWTDFGRLIQEVFQGDWRGALEVGARMLTHFVDAVMAGLNLLWVGIQAFFTKIDWGALLRASIDRIGDLTSWLLAKGTQLVQGLWNGIQNNWLSVATWLADLGLKAVAALPSLSDMAGFLVDHGGQLLTGLWNGIKAIWGEGAAEGATAAGWLADLGNKAIAALPSLGEMVGFLEAHGKGLMHGIFNGLKAIWNGFGGGGVSTVAGWLLDLGRKAVAAMPSLGEMVGFLKDHGIQLLQGLYNGVKDRFEAVAAWLGLLPDRVQASVPYMANVLYNDGYDMIWGLAQGVYGAASLVIAAVNYIIGLIPEKLRGMMGIGSPAKKMIPFGYAITEGVAVGMLAGLETVNRASANIAGAALTGNMGMAGRNAAYAAGNGPSRVNTITFAPGSIVVQEATNPAATADAVFRVFTSKLQRREGS